MDTFLPRQDQHKYFIQSATLRVGLACYGINPLQQEDSAFSSLKRNHRYARAVTVVQIKKIVKDQKLDIAERLLHSKIQQ